MVKQLALLFGLSVMVLFLAKATDLASALESGKVCELPSGYIQATSGHEDEMATLVADVNNKRTHIYSQIAQQEGVDPATVGTTRAQQEKSAYPEKFCR